MLFSGGQDGKMAADLGALLCTVEPVHPVRDEDEALVAYVKPPVRTLGAVDHCGRVRVLLKQTKPG